MDFVQECVKKLPLEFGAEIPLLIAMRTEESIG